MPREAQKFTSELMESGRYRYEETDEYVHLIAQDFGVSRSYFDRLINRWGWRRRKDRPPREMPQSQQILRQLDAPSPPEEPTGLKVPIESVVDQAEGRAGADAPALPSLVERLERAVERELAAVELMRAQYGALPLPPMAAERTARTLATLTETLFKARRLRVPDLPIAGANDFDDLPQDIDEFRNELARRIDVFVRSRIDAILPATGELVGADSAQR